MPGGPAAVRRAAHAILARPEFQPTPDSPATIAKRWVLHQMARLLSTILGGGRFGVLGAVFAIAVVVALVVVVVLAARSTGPNPVRSGVFVVSGARRPPAEWLAEAAARETQGDWRGGLRARYRALVAELAARGLVEEVPGRTTGEYRRAVAGALPRSADDFAGATDLFERAWYGDEATDAGDATRFRELADRVSTGAR